jgi:hypothetical protein
VELVYKPYLNILWLLSYYKLGKRPPSEPPALGEMLRVASDRLQDYPGLLDVDAVWIRNSAVHDPPNPNLQEGSLRLTDQKGSHRSFAVDDLISRAESLYLLAAQTMQYVAMLYFYREFILRTGLNDMIAECIALELAGDKNKLAEAEQRAQAHADSLLDPLLRLLKQK